MVFKLTPPATAGGAWIESVLHSFTENDGNSSHGRLIFDKSGALYGTTASAGGAGGHGSGTVFEIAGSGFVVPATFAGTPGKPNCHGESVSALARQYGGLSAAAAALGYSSVSALQEAIAIYCAG
jgi:hypothetical protein